MTEIPYDPLYLRGIEQFNREEFFEAHDTWEELWTEFRGEGRNFYKGLIQTAVALHHAGNNNYHGARKLYGTSRNYLKAYLPFYQGIDLRHFLASFECCFAEVLEAEDISRPISIAPETIPKIHLQDIPAG